MATVDVLCSRRTCT